MVMFKKALIFSGLLHTAVLGAAVVGFATTSKLDVAPPQPVPVNILTASEFTKIKAGEKKPKPEKEVKPKTEQKKVAEAEPTPAKAKPKKTTKAKPVRQATQKKEQAKAKPIPPRKPKKVPPKKKKVAQKKKTAPSKPKPKNNKAKIAKKDFQPDKIAALLNKIPAEQQATGSTKPPEKKTDVVPEGRPDGTDIKLSVNEIDAMRAQISRCWILPIGGLGADRIVVRIRFQLEKNGQLSRQPSILNASSSPFFRSAAESAVRAIVDCQPYKLPAEKYRVWRDIVLNFDPRQMYGG